MQMGIVALHKAVCNQAGYWPIENRISIKDSNLTTDCRIEIYTAREGARKWDYPRRAGDNKSVSSSEWHTFKRTLENFSFLVK